MQINTYGLWRDSVHDSLIVALSAGDLGINIDFGLSEPGEVLQRWDGEGWQDYWQDGKPFTQPFDYTTLPPGRYQSRRAKVIS